MKQSDAYNYIIKEYLSKCKKYGCDSCFAQFYCIDNNLRHDRYPQDDCDVKIKECLRKKRSN